VVLAVAVVTRRTVLGSGLAAAVGLGVGLPYALVPTGDSSTGRLLPSRIPRPTMFSVVLPVPAVLRPDRSDSDGDHYTITQRTAMAEIVPGYATPLWTYNGTFPGPSIESRAGRAALVRHINQLPVPTVVHLHGGHTPHESDGYPIDYNLPSDPTYYETHMSTSPHMSMRVGATSQGSRDYTYPLKQRAATLWYHDHRMEFTGPSVWRGLAGFHFVRDDEEDALRLPAGPYEIPLMLTDRSFGADGSLAYPSIDPTLVNIPGVTGGYTAGVLGDTMLVNGVPWPIATVDQASYRLRVLNASNARRLALRLDPAPPAGIVQIGTDGGLLASPVVHDHLVVAPAQRFDVIVDFSGYRPGTVVTLVNDFDSGPMGQVMQFRTSERAGPRFAIPDRLSTITPLVHDDATTTRSFRFRAGNAGPMDGWVIDSEPFDPATATATVPLGTVEIWQLFADLHHPVHLHLNPFQIIARGTDGPGEFDHGWKDTIDLKPAEQAAIAVRFEDYPGRYVFHCHNLEHEDMAMMANVDVR